MITIRELLIRFGVDADDKALKDFNQALTAVVKTAAAAVAAVTALTVGVVAQTVATARLSEETIRQSESLGLTIEGYQELVAVFEDFDAEAADVADALVTITDRAEDAAAGATSMAEDFALVGLTIDKKFLALSPADRFLAFADAVSTTENDSKRLAATARILGDDIGRKLSPLMLKGADGIRRLQEEARRAGKILDEDAVRGAAEAAKSFRRLGVVVEGLRNLIGVSFAPLVGRLVDRIADFILTNRKLIAQRLDRAVELITFAVDELLQGLDVVNTFIVEEVGGWKVIFLQAAKASALLATAGGLVTFGRLLFLAKGAVFTLGAAVSGLSLPVAAGFLAIAAAVAVAVLVIDDFLTFLRGGRSVIGGFLEEVGRTEPFLEKFNDLLQTTLELAEALKPALGAIFSPFILSTKEINDALEGLNTILDVGLPPAIQGVEAAMVALTDILDLLVVGIETLEKAAEGFSLEALSLVATGGIGATPGEIATAGAGQAAEVIRPRARAVIEALQGSLGIGAMGMGGGTSTSTSMQFQGGATTNTFSTNVSRDAIAEVLRQQGIEERRQALEAFRGGDR